MTPKFESFSAFLAMGGYGFFVWLSFGVTLLVVALMIFESHYTKKQLVSAVNAQIARKKRIKAHHKPSPDHSLEKTTDVETNKEEVSP